MTNPNPHYIATGPVSVPVAVDLTPDVDLNGFKFSYEHGIFFSPVVQNVTLKLPPPLNTVEQSRQFS